MTAAENTNRQFTTFQDKEVAKRYMPHMIKPELIEEPTGFVVYHNGYKAA